MVFFLPTGQSGERSRRPLVTTTIAALCVASFFATSFSDSPPTEDKLASVRLWVDDHPWVLEDYDGELPPSGELRADVHEFERMIDALGGRERRWSLVPARGPAQVGWLTALFVHFDIIHLLGNLLFLWIVGPLLEEAWGRGRFTAFYLFAGLISSFVQFMANRHEFVAIGGASGAIAGCMGAFALRFAHEKIRFHYLVWLFRVVAGEVWVPAWLCGLAWFGNELWNLKSGSAPGVATAAHIGGFVAGALFALVMRAMSRDDEHLTGAESREVQQRIDNAFAEARSALKQGGYDYARELLLSVQERQPDYPGLLALLAEADLYTGNGHARFERLLRELLAKSDREVELLVARLHSTIDPRALSPTTAWQLAERLRRDDPASPFAGALLDGVANGTGALALKARALLAPPAPPREPVRVLAAKVVAVQPQGLIIDLDGQSKKVPFAAIDFVHAGTVSRALLVDIGVKTQPVVLRLAGDDGAVLKMFPGQSPVNAWQSFLAGLRRATGAEASGAPWTNYDSMADFTASRPSRAAA